MTSEARVESSRAGRLEDLYTRNAPGAMRLAYFLTGDRELAVDLVQDAGVDRSLKRMRRYRDRAP